MAPEGRERYPLRFGAPAVVIDGEVGSLRGVVMAPRSGNLDGVVIRKKFLIPRDVLVPPEALVSSPPRRGVEQSGSSSGS